MGRFGLGRFGLSRFGPGSFRPILVSRFGLILFNPYILYNILYARCVCYTRLVNHAASLARVRGSITGFTFISFLTFSHLELNIILKKKSTLEISRVMSVSNKNETSYM